MQSDTKIDDILNAHKARPARRVLAGLLVAGALGGLGAAAWWALGPREAPARYLTEPAQRRDITVTVGATGTVEPTTLVEVSSELSGTIREVLVSHNAQVRAGDVLARLETERLEAALEHARATLAMRTARLHEAEATLREAQATLARSVALAQSGVLTEQALSAADAARDRAAAAHESALADQRVARADLRLAEADLSRACICAPIDGVVLDVAADAGQTVAATLQAPVLFTLAGDLRQMELHVDIDEADIARVSVGDAALFSVEAYRARQFPARVAALRLAPETVEGVVTYKAVLEIDNADLALRPGMTATAEITVAHLANVLAVPNAALRFAPPAAPTAPTDDAPGLLGLVFRSPERPAPPPPALGNGLRPLWVLRGGAMVQIAVRPGASDGRFTEIPGANLAEGDAVIVAMEG